jgi:hypothetical protein
MEPQEPDEAIRKLHRYFVWADWMRTHFYAFVPKVGNKPAPEQLSGENTETDRYMSFWYAELYVVYDGWNDLKLADREVERLLVAEQSTHLLFFYNKHVFEFISSRFGEDYLGFVRGGRDAARWVDPLHEAFGAYFRQRLASGQSVS